MPENTFIDLPKPQHDSEMSLEESILKRRSKRSYAAKELSLAQIGQLLWAAQGITDERRGFRAAPSAGALYPLAIYLVKKDGFYHYDIKGHRLELIKPEDLRPALTKAAWGQGFISQAPVSIVICAVYSRITSRYGMRGNRYVDIEVGHAAQNVHLQAVALGLGSVPVGAYSDEEVSRILELPREEIPLYIIPVGYTK
jgi:SagB-type dehydrogenase family enzyme